MAKPTAPVTEIGYAQAVNYNWWLYEDETTPELIWPQSNSVYDSMRRTDAQVASVLRAVTLPVRRTPWRIDPAGARASVVKFVADDLGLPIVGKQMKPVARRKDRFSWADHLRQALLMLVFGHMYFEQVYRVNDAGTQAHLRKLAPRMPKTIERIDVAADGGLISIQQYWTRVDTEPKPIPANRLVGYVNDREAGNWLGTSILRPAYKHWLIKDRLLRVQAQTIERNGMGIPLYTGNELEEDLSAGLSMATKWRAGEAAGSAVPFGSTLKLVGVEGELPDAQPAIDYHDSQIARAVLAHFLNLGQQTGSWALGTTFADFFTLSLQTLAQQIADTVTQHVIEDIVDLNFGPDEPAPVLCFDEIGSRQAATAAALKTLVDAGVIRPDEVLEETSRQQYGLPPADPSTVRTPPEPAQAPEPAPTEMGDTSPSVNPVAAAAHSPKGEEGKHQLHEYWTRGEGLAKWASSAHPWTELYHHLLKYIHSDHEAKATAAAWYHDVFGHWPGGHREVKAKFDPTEPRDPHSGKWGLGGEAEGAVKDALKLADRIQLGKGEKFAGSGKVRDKNGDMSAVLAAVDTAAGRQVRLGLVLPEHERSWRAADKGGTVELDKHGAAQLRETLSGAAEAGRDSVKNYYADVRKAHAGHLPAERWPDPETEIASGTIRAGWGNLQWALRRDADAGPEIPGIDAPGAGWSLELQVVPNSGAVQGTDPLYLDTAAKAKALEGLLAELAKSQAAPTSRALSARALEAAEGAAPEQPGDDEEGDEWEELIAALVLALHELKSERAVQAAFDPSKHVRNPKGSPGGGRFRSMVDRLKDAITEHQSSGRGGHPFEGFDREQLRRVAKARGIDLKRGEDRDSIAGKLLDHLGPAKKAETPKPAVKKAAPKAVARPLGDKALKGLTDEQIDNGIEMHGTETARGKQLVEEKRRRAETVIEEKPTVVQKVPPSAPKPPARDVPDPAKPFHRNLDGIESLAEAVEDGEPPKKRVTLTGGVSAETELVTLKGGTKVVHKYGGNADAEQASSMIGRSLGLSAPRIYRDQQSAVYMDFVDDAKTYDQLRMAAVDDSLHRLDAEVALHDKRAAALASDDAKLVGLLDLMIINADRNDGNWMISNSDPTRVIPIDHGHAFQYTGDSGGRIRPVKIDTIFTNHYLANSAKWGPNDLTQADVAEIRDRLESRRPDFQHISRERWLDYAIAVLDGVAPHATGSRNLVAGVR